MCGRCTIVGHVMADCRRRGNRTCDKTKADGSRCTSRHASFLHGTMRLDKMSQEWYGDSENKGER